MSHQAGWYADPLGRFEHRYFDGATWTEHVARGGNRAIDALDRPTPVAPAPAQVQYAAVADGQAAVPEVVAKRRKVMSWLMMGCAGVVFLAAFLPWGTSRAGDLSGFEWGPGKYTALLSIGLMLYGAQGLSPSWGRVRFHGWVIPIITVIVLIALTAQAAIDTVNSATFGVGNLEPGPGLLLTILVPLVAIWPLVMLWRDNRKPRQVVMVNAAPAAAPAMPPAPSA